MAGEIYGQSVTPNISTGNPETVNDATALAPLGSLYRYKGNLYRYVKFTEGGVTGIANGVVYWITLTPTTNPPVWTVCADQSDTGSIQAVAGVIKLIPTDGYYVWIQVGGVSLTKVTAAKAIGSRVVGNTVDLTFGTTTTATTPATLATVYLQAYGVMLTASTTAATANVLLHNLDW